MHLYVHVITGNYMGRPQQVESGILTNKPKTTTKLKRQKNKSAKFSKKLGTRRIKIIN